MVPLVFKTSLGAVRPPEGSTPSLLRQDQMLIRHPSLSPMCFVRGPALTDNKQSILVSGSRDRT